MSFLFDVGTGSDDPSCADYNETRKKPVSSGYNKR
jgi:hypothetical protein